MDRVRAEPDDGARSVVLGPRECLDLTPTLNPNPDPDPNPIPTPNPKPNPTPTPNTSPTQVSALLFHDAPGFKAGRGTITWHSHVDRFTLGLGLGASGYRMRVVLGFR